MSYLRLVRVSKTYHADGRAVEALAGMDLEVRQGEFVALVGPSGCGKTTLLHLVAGLEAPTSGRIELAGEPIRGCSRDRALVFQEPTLFPWLTAVDNVAFGLRTAGVPLPERRERALTLLESLGLDGFATSYPHQLSGGMRQRVAIARALAVCPQVLLLDEPFASVDALTREALQEELVRIWQVRRPTILFVTHSREEALALADRVIVLSPRPGRVRAELALPMVRPRSPVVLAPWLERLKDLLAQP
jgi:NitT/TauT family transport system ATP-binding protein